MLRRPKLIELKRVQGQPALHRQIQAKEGYIAGEYLKRRWVGGEGSKEGEGGEGGEEKKRRKERSERGREGGKVAGKGKEDPLLLRAMRTGQRRPGRRRLQLGEDAGLCLGQGKDEVV